VGIAILPCAAGVHKHFLQLIDKQLFVYIGCKYTDSAPGGAEST
jgi:hypothetical protein